MTELIKVLCPIWHKTGHFGEILPSQSVGIALNKLYLAQRKQTTPEQNGKNTQKAS